MQRRAHRIVCGAMDVSAETARYFRHDFEKTGSVKNVVLFMNSADDPAIECIVTPLALTAAESFAHTREQHVFAILSHAPSYGDAWQEVSTAQGEVPGLRGDPGRRYTDLSTSTNEVSEWRIAKAPPHRSQPSPCSTTMSCVASSTPLGTLPRGKFSLTAHRTIVRNTQHVSVLPPLNQLVKRGIGKRDDKIDLPKPGRKLHVSDVIGQDTRAMNVGDKQVFCGEKGHARMNCLKFSTWLAGDKQGPSDTENVEHASNRLGNQSFATTGGKLEPGKVTVSDSRVSASLRRRDRGQESVRKLPSAWMSNFVDRPL